MKLLINLLSWKFFVFIGIVGIVYYFMFCFSLFPYEDSEVLRVNSPDNKVDAVHIYRNAGAMKPAWDLIYIVPAKQEIKKEYKKDYYVVFQGKQVYDLEFRWESAEKLLVQFRKADIKHFRNYIYPFPYSPSQYPYKVSVSEKQIEVN
jgi:hypothetical protein